MEYQNFFYLFSVLRCTLALLWMFADSFTPRRRWDAFWLSGHAMYSTRGVCVRYIHCKRYIFLTVREIDEDMGATATNSHCDCQRNRDIFMCRKYPTQQKANNNSSSFFNYTSAQRELRKPQYTHSHKPVLPKMAHTGKFAGRTRAKLNKFRVRRDALALTPKTATSANLPKNMTSVYFSSLRIEEWSKRYPMWCIILLIIQFILPWS